MTQSDELKTTCLHDMHVAMDAKMAPFGGFDMPIEYDGIEVEHQAVRNGVGMFDVSHMGEVRIYGADALRFVNHIFTNDVNLLGDGQIAYGMLTNPQGGVVDDLLVYRVSPTEFFLVINASNIDKDEQWILGQLEEFNADDLTVDCESSLWSEIALQGPKAQETLQQLLPNVDLAEIGFYCFKQFTLEVEYEDGGQGEEQLIVSRTGYTGEDGFELYASDGLIQGLWDALLHLGVQPCGLGCRDTLRFEAGLPLYGHELSDEITPIEAGLGMFVKLDKPEFIGREVLAAQKAEGVKQKVVGIEIDAPAIARQGYEVLNADGEVVGHITTGYRSITLERNIAMALVDARYAALDTPLQVRVRRKTFPARVIKKRFYTPKYKK